MTNGIGQQYHFRMISFMSQSIEILNFITREAIFDKIFRLQPTQKMHLWVIKFMYTAHRHAASKSQ